MKESHEKMDKEIRELEGKEKENSQHARDILEVALVAKGIREDKHYRLNINNE